MSALRGPISRLNCRGFFERWVVWDVPAPLHSLLAEPHLIDYQVRQLFLFSRTFPPSSTIKNGLPSLWIFFQQRNQWGVRALTGDFFFFSFPFSKQEGM